MPGALAVDRDWRVLDRTWPPSERRFTSVTFLVDRDGRIVWLHGGGELKLDSAEYREFRAAAQAVSH